MDTNDATSPIVLPPTRKDLRTCVEDVFHDMGGSKALHDWVAESTVNKRIFFKDILPKLIPRDIRQEISGKGGEPMKMVIQWQGDQPAPAIGDAANSLLKAIAADPLD
jgi:hypothetical protein